MNDIFSRQYESAEDWQLTVFFIVTIKLTDGHDVICHVLIDAVSSTIQSHADVACRKTLSSILYLPNILQLFFGIEVANFPENYPRG